MTKLERAKKSMQWTVGILQRFQAFLGFRYFSVSRLSIPSRCEHFPAGFAVIRRMTTLLADP
jgi:hypothetical protein